MMEAQRRAAVLTWGSKMSRRVCRSTFGSELLSAVNGFDAAEHCKGLYEQMSGKAVMADAYSDCASLVETMSSYKPPGTAEKRMHRDIAILRQTLEMGVISSMSWISTAEQLADHLTKTTTDPHLLQTVLQSGRMFVLHPMLRSQGQATVLRQPGTAA